MGLQPFDWGVVIIGRWNPAIFTPGRVAEKIFKLPSNIWVEVDVPLDGVSALRIRHPKDKIVIMTDNERLRVLLDEAKMNYGGLAKAMRTGIDILEWLPETPVFAAGFNVKYRTSEPPSKLLSMITQSDIDNACIDIGYSIVDRTLGRSLRYKKGKLNVNLLAKDDICEVLCNFHQESKKNKDLIEWLETPRQEIESEVKRIFDKLELDVEESADDDGK